MSLSPILREKSKMANWLVSTDFNSDEKTSSLHFYDYEGFPILSNSKHKPSISKPFFFPFVFFLNKLKVKFLLIQFIPINKSPRRSSCNSPLFREFLLFNNSIC